MKKLAIISLVFAFVTLAAFTTRSRWATVSPAPVPLMDSAQVFDLRSVRAMHSNNAAIVQAARYYREFMDSMPYGEDLKHIMLQALRSYPVPALYRDYQGVGSEDTFAIPLSAMQDSLHGSITAMQYFDAARYALTIRDTTSMIRILQWYMDDDTAGYIRVDREPFLSPLRTIPTTTI